MAQLKKIISETEKQLGVTLAYYREGEKLSGVPFCDKQFEGVTDDGSYTFFRFSFQNAGYIGVLTGVGEQQNNYALLLPSYLESFIDREAELSKTEHLKRILRGECSSLGLYKFAAKFSVKDIPCYALALRIPKLLDDAMEIVEQYGGNTLDTAVVMDETTCVLVKFVLAGDEEEESGVTYATTLAQSLKEELGIDVTIGVGPIVRDYKEIRQSYAGAEHALRYAGMFAFSGDVHSYQEFALLKLIEDTPKAALQAYVAEFGGEGFEEIYKDAEMLETAEEFLRNSLNISETSRNLYLHRNTLLYRLDKIEKTTGLNIRLFSDALSFYVLTAIYRFLGK